MKIDMQTYLIYLLVMAGVTLFLRAVPFILLRKKLKSVFWSSFLAYVPYTVLSAMTVPAIFFATDSRLTGACALLAAVVASLLGKARDRSHSHKTTAKKRCNDGCK